MQWLNNPLTIIQGSSSIISKVVDQEPLDKEMLKALTGKIISTTERITKIVKSLKNLSRKGDNDPITDVDLQNIIDQCLGITGQRITHQEIQLILPEFSEPIYFKSREVQISQAIVNLLANAVDAVKPLSERWIKLSYKTTDNELIISIIDSGGIPETVRARIMEPLLPLKM